MSFDSSGLPETVCAPEITQLLEPTADGWPISKRAMDENSKIADIGFSPDDESAASAVIFPSSFFGR